VFSIWGLIYIGLIAYAIYQVLPAQRDNPRLQSIAYIFILSCLANIAWLFLWHYEIFEFTLVAMLVLITVATIANTTQLLYYLGWNGWGISPEIWAVIILAAGVIISVLMSLTRTDIAYSLVLVWAYIGIAFKHANTPIVAYAALIGASFILVILILVMIRKYRDQGMMQTG
jgi:hypothetical protein